MYKFEVVHSARAWGGRRGVPKRLTMTRICLCRCAGAVLNVSLRECVGGEEGEKVMRSREEPRSVCRAGVSASEARLRPEAEGGRGK